MGGNKHEARRDYPVDISAPIITDGRRRAPQEPSWEEFGLFAPGGSGIGGEEFVRVRVPDAPKK